MTARVNGMSSGRAQRLALRSETPQTARAVPHRVLAVEMAADEHVQPGAGTAAGLLGQLQRDEAGSDDVVAPDDALVFDTEDLIEIDATERHEGRRRVRGPTSAGAWRRHDGRTRKPSLINLRA